MIRRFFSHSNQRIVPNLLSPPGPRSHVPLRVLHAFRRDPLAFLTQVASTYGDVAHFRLRRRDMYLLSHPDLVRDVW